MLCVSHEILGCVSSFDVMCDAYLLPTPQRHLLISHTNFSHNYQIFITTGTKGLPALDASVCNDTRMTSYASATLKSEAINSNCAILSQSRLHALYHHIPESIYFVIYYKHLNGGEFSLQKKRVNEFKQRIQGSRDSSK